MSFKPTFASVTDIRCTCGYLEEAASDPESPIVFDEQTAEFQFKYTCQGDDGGSQSMLVIYHCPFCGGAAPESKRPLLFAVIPEAEEVRLAQLLNPIETIQDALKLFGTPDIDGHCTNRYQEKENEPPSIQYYREIGYENLSDIADVRITERPDGKVYWGIYGKYLRS